MDRPKPPSDSYDAIVAGGGHAGCEAAMALAKLGADTLLVTINVDRLGHLSCNPAIGGLAKGHMVREVDALGGMMGLWADEAGIQFRRLNTRKGPAVRATRAQMDRDAYMAAVKRDLFAQPGLSIWQDTVVDILVAGGRVTGARTQLGKTFHAPHLLLTTGTFLAGRIHVGLDNFSGGRLGDPASLGLTERLNALGIRTGRLKTGTTPRLLKSSIDFSAMEEQPGDAPPPGFSFHGPGPRLPQVPCHITWTNERTHDAIRSGLDRSPLYAGVITGVGARYCPSIEDKVARFPDKERHQVFVEPEGLTSPECYPNGVPTSLPLDVQEAFIRTIPGLEAARIVRPGYAIEYDCVFPTQLAPSLEARDVPGLWCAGQINGTSGYEEAAAQGLVAALNIARRLRGDAPLVLGRDQAYAGVLVDDLVTKGAEEPYRMFTSRAEHRLLLREGNADQRLTPLGRELGLVDDARWGRFRAKTRALDELMERLRAIRVRPDAATRDALTAAGAAPPGKAVSLAEVLRQPPVTLRGLQALLPELEACEDEVLDEAETAVKYEGYLVRQAEMAARDSRLAETALPPDLDYAAVAGLSNEVVSKLTALRPATLAQAGRISGVTPAALSCLLVALKKRGLL